MSQALRWGPAIAWAGLIAVLSHQSLEVSGTVSSFDWLAHMVAFGVLALTLGWGLSDRGRQLLSRRALAGIWLLTLLYGVLDEYHQSFIPNRDPSTADVIADGIGAAIAIGVLARLSGRLSGRSSKE